VIDIVCDNCEKPFEVDPVEAGGKVACPRCGDMNRVPEKASEPAARDEPAAAPAAPLPSGERSIMVVRPGMFRARPIRYIFIVLAFLGGIVLAIGSRSSDRIWPWLLWPGLVVSLLALLWFAQWWTTTHWWVKLTISNKRTIRHEGIVRRHTTEVLHDHVRSVDINQTFLQRILRVGSIGIDSAGQDEIEIEVADIPNPYQVKAVIDKHRKM
jgi:hypothetical protein